ncbi:N-acetylmuramoyl-L-alanine amidase [Streptomyces sp. MMS24-I2-30]|uniref:N-acetylmuramoyl-L-alanine amidase n=1 Tax=Streptomyces sp. MMS24-I2-30 TaxID=3351564 RepID=UPI003896953A
MHKRKSRKKLLAAVVAVAAAGFALPAIAQAAGPGDSGDSGQQADYADAASKFKVPESVLLGVAYAESQWDEHKGQYNTSGGYGPMSLTDVTAKMLAGGGAGEAGRAGLSDAASDPAMHTLTKAAKLLDVSPEEVRKDSRTNILGGAALLASYQKELTGETSSDPAAWYGAVARYSGSSDQAVAGAFADRVFAQMKKGAKRTTAEGDRVSLDSDPSLKPSPGQLQGLKLNATSTTPQAECPPGLPCTFLPADPSNYQVANRPADDLDVKYIVIHDTESSYDAAVSAFQKAGNGDAANYIMAADGRVTQMVPNQNVALHAGNYWFNMHSIGIEHEGFAAHGATWYTQSVYQDTADLVKYLAAKYDIPLDREHVIGHDNVPGPLDDYVAGMHWDPGPYWDWNTFMAMVDAPVDDTPHGVGQVGTAVTINPEFAANKQTTKVCPYDDPTGEITECTDQTEPSNFLYVRTEPSTDASLFTDPGLHKADAKGTDEISDWGSTVSQGQQFVVADVSGDWTAIWYAGAKVWFYNPGGVNTSPATGVKVVGAAGDSAVDVYGSGYPQPSEYPADLKPSTEAPLSAYSIPAGQAYVATQEPVSTDDFFKTGDVLVKGAGKLYTIQYNHRVALVDASDVTVHKVRVRPRPGTAQN